MDKQAQDNSNGGGPESEGSAPQVIEKPNAGTGAPVNEDQDTYIYMLDRRIQESEKRTNEKIALIGGKVDTYNYNAPILNFQGVLLLVLGAITMSVLLGGAAALISNIGVIIALFSSGVCLWFTVAVFYITQQLRGYYEAKSHSSD